jgi:hypothetical protein
METKSMDNGNWPHETDASGKLSIVFNQEYTVSKIVEGTQTYYQFLLFLVHQGVWAYLADAAYSPKDKKVVFQKRDPQPGQGMDMLVASRELTDADLNDPAWRDEYEKAQKALEEMRKCSPREPGHQKFLRDFKFPQRKGTPECYRCCADAFGNKHLVIIWGFEKIGFSGGHGTSLSEPKIPLPPPWPPLPAELKEQRGGHNPPVEVGNVQRGDRPIPPQGIGDNISFFEKAFVWLESNWKKILSGLLAVLLLLLILFFISQCRRPNLGGINTPAPPVGFPASTGVSAPTIRGGVSVQSPTRLGGSTSKLTDGKKIGTAEAHTIPYSSLLSTLNGQKVEIKVASSDEINRNRELLITLEVLPSLGEAFAHEIKLFNSQGELLDGASERRMLMRLPSGEYKATARIFDSSGSYSDAVREFTVGEKGMFVK